MSQAPASKADQFRRETKEFWSKMDQKEKAVGTRHKAASTKTQKKTKTPKRKSSAARAAPRKKKS